MKIALLCLVLAIVAVAGVYGNPSRHVCRVTEGKKMMAFSHDKHRVKFPCKYPVVRDTRCGNWTVRVTAGNDFAYTRRGRNSDVYTSAMWISLENVETGKVWKGRTSLKIAKKYLEANEEYPFRQKQKKEGDLETGYFEFGPRCEDRTVSIMTPDGAVKISFYLWEGPNAWKKESGFKVEFNCDNFQTENFPKQLCGNGTKGEAKEHRKAVGLNEHEAILLSVFTTKGIAQTNTYCMRAEDIMLNTCKNDDDRKAAIQSCWPLFVRGRIRDCVRRNRHGDNMQIFTDCLEYVCTGSPCDSDSRENLHSALGGCQNIGRVTKALKRCDNSMEVDYCEAPEPEN